MMKDLLIAYLSSNSLFTLLSHLYSKRGKVEEPVGLVSVVMPAWHEPTDLVISSIESLLNNNVVLEYPEAFEFILVGCEGIDLGGLHQYFDKVLCSKPGKLHARHLGIIESSGDIIAAVDADTIYPENWLNEMLKPFKDPEVVATTCRTSFIDHIELDFLFYPASIFIYAGRMLGRGSCFLKEAYLEVGGFDINADYEGWDEVFKEEEMNFADKLRKIGRIVFVDVPCYTITRLSTPYRLASPSQYVEQYPSYY